MVDRQWVVCKYMFARIPKSLALENPTTDCASTRSFCYLRFSKNSTRKRFTSSEQSTSSVSSSYGRCTQRPTSALLKKWIWCLHATVFGTGRRRSTSPFSRNRIPSLCKLRRGARASLTLRLACRVHDVHQSHPDASPASSPIHPDANPASLHATSAEMRRQWSSTTKAVWRWSRRLGWGPSCENLALQVRKVLSQCG